MTIVKSIMLNNELVVRLPQSLDILENQEFYVLDKARIIRLIPRSVNLYKDAEEGHIIKEMPLHKRI
ncbi:hypothetical protein HBP99_07415 [Listeria booriae]|uniref:hypothetical protein n=1 Tax=Listeria booriae TaxID=1552123 RepID=UPI001629D159|nr:hypothetical protein [Listeria booriae]MBC2368459.1 hypothetical protein [Listeria booriae]